MAQTNANRWQGLFTLLVAGALVSGTAFADGFGRGDGRPDEGRYGDGRFGGDRQEIARRLADRADQLFKNVAWAEFNLELKDTVARLNGASQATAFCFSRMPRFDERGPDGRGPGWDRGGGWGGRRCEAELDFARRMAEQTEMQARNVGPMAGLLFDSLREIRFMIERLGCGDDHGGGAMLSVAGVIERFPFQFAGRSAGEIQAQCEAFAREKGLWNIGMYEIYGARYFGPATPQMACINIAQAAQVQRR